MATNTGNATMLITTTINKKTVIITIIKGIIKAAIIIEIQGMAIGMRITLFRPIGISFPDFITYQASLFLFQQEATGSYHNVWELY